MNKRIYKITAAALFLVLGIVFPQIFHLTGISAAGNIFLPMHIPVLLCGFMLGPWYGAAIGFLSPLISSLCFAMPAFARLPFMMLELLTYGFVSGFLYKKIHKIYLTLIISMISGRIVYAICLLFATYLFNIKCGGVIAAFTATVTGFPGIIIQLILVPVLVHALLKYSLIFKGINQNGTN